LGAPKKRNLNQNNNELEKKMENQNNNELEKKMENQNNNELEKKIEILFSIIEDLKTQVKHQDDYIKSLEIRVDNIECDIENLQEK